ncbi:MAG: hypothetical protein KDK91_13205 [Gammaproteobacteria bacterium]|nr:hypothetical protein [Gammaproteobacteria bacterium]
MHDQPYGRVFRRASGCLVGGVTLLAALALAPLVSNAADGTPRRVLHVMSYHQSWEWNRDQLQGFKDALQDVPVEYQVYEMDTKRRSSEAWKQQAADEARALIDGWKPDLVYTNDDNAQQYVARHYVGQSLPFVFSGVNAAPSDYGFENSPNVTGVLEVEHSLQTIRLLRQIVPGVKRVALIVDEGPTWPGVVKRVREAFARESGLEVVAVDRISDFAQYKQVVMDYQGKVDALGILGVFTFEDEKGEHVPYQDVLRWTAQNSRVPDFSFWGDRTELGTLVAVRVSGYAQGFAAGEMARAILVDGRSPASIPMAPTVRGEPTVSLARARALGLKIPSSLLLNAHVQTKFRWDS